MKTSNIKTTITNVIFASSVIFGIASCEHKESEHKASDSAEHTGVTKDVAEDQNDAKFAKNKEEKNATFLVKATEINMEEIKLGELAEKKSAHKDVKALAKMMITAHTKGLAEVKALAAKKSITVPTEVTQDAKDEYAKLDEKTEKDFNKAYADKMVSGHKDAIELFEKASTDSSDEDIRNWAASMLPELRKHLDHAMAVQKACEAK